MRPRFTRCARRCTPHTGDARRTQRIVNHTYRPSGGPMEPTVARGGPDRVGPGHGPPTCRSSLESPGPRANPRFRRDATVDCRRRRPQLRAGQRHPPCGPPPQDGRRRGRRRRPGRLRRGRTRDPPDTAAGKRRHSNRVVHGTVDTGSRTADAGPAIDDTDRRPLGDAAPVTIATQRHPGSRKSRPVLAGLLRGPRHGDNLRALADDRAVGPDPGRLPRDQGQDLLGDLLDRRGRHGHTPQLGHIPPVRVDPIRAIPD